MGGLERIQSDAGIEIRLDLVGFVAFPPGHSGIVHNHAFWELIYVGGGKGTIGRKGGVHPCSAGDLVLVAPGEKHQFISKEAGPLDQMYVGFSFQSGGSAAPVPALPRILPSTPPLQLIRAEVKECHDLLKTRGKEALKQVRLRLMPVMARLAGLIATLGEPSAAKPSKTKNPVLMARELLHSDLQASISVVRLAKQFCLSPKYFGETFKRELGMTVKEYQNDLRLARARELLLESDKPIAAIAAEVGIENTAYFARQFRKKFHISARELRHGKPLESALRDGIRP